jgi:DNA-binding NarL/FixJ family response regulator
MKRESKVRVLLVDDRQVVMEGLRHVLEQDEEIEVVGEAGNGYEAISKAIELSPDVIIMDLNTAGMHNITAIRELKRRLPGVNVLMLTLYAEDFVEQAVEAVHQVYDGFYPIAPSLTRQLVAEYIQSGLKNRPQAVSKVSQKRPICQTSARNIPDYDLLSSQSLASGLFSSAEKARRNCP